MLYTTDERESNTDRILRKVDKSNPVELHVCTIGHPIPYFLDCLKDYRAENGQKGINDIYHQACGTDDLDIALKIDSKINIIYFSMAPCDQVMFLEMYADIMVQRNILPVLYRDKTDHASYPVPFALREKLGKIEILHLLNALECATISSIAPTFEGMLQEFGKLKNLEVAK
jgi:hypothetical protein